MSRAVSPSSPYALSPLEQDAEEKACKPSISESLIKCCRTSDLVLNFKDLVHTLLAWFDSREVRSSQHSKLNCSDLDWIRYTKMITKD